MPPLDLTAIRARAEAATKGPWRVGDDIGDGPCVETTDANHIACYCFRSCGSRYGNAAFIAASRADIPALCDEVERLRERLRHGEEFGGDNWRVFRCRQGWCAEIGGKLIDRAGAVRDEVFDTDLDDDLTHLTQDAAWAALDAARREP